MRRFVVHMIYAAVALLGTTGLWSCVYDRDSGDAASGGEADGNTVLMVLSISPLAVTNAQAATVEKIRTLRIIIIGQEYDDDLRQAKENYIVECNRLINVGSSVSASQFSYNFTWPTKPGSKKVYLIANEQSVSEISYTGSDGSLPDKLDGLLALYGPEGSAADGERQPISDGAKFESAINSVYFAPEYTTDNDEIFLPYVSFYDGIEAANEEITPLEMYLVPVATKFVYEFTNNRGKPVDIISLEVLQTNCDNYLMAHVGQKDISKVFNGEGDYFGMSLYWIDWLAKVAEASQKRTEFEDNEKFNGEYGWILDYAMPTERKITATMVDYSADRANAPQVPEPQRQMDGSYTEGHLTLGPFYYPESRNFDNAGDPGDNRQDGPTAEQIYCLTMLLEDSGTHSSPIFENVPISNLQALFRNTYVIIRVTMNDGSVDAYAELIDWNYNRTNGTVTGS